MEHKCVNHLEQIFQEDWGKTPTSVKKLVEEMAQQIEKQEKKIAEVLTAQEQLSCCAYNLHFLWFEALVATGTLWKIKDTTAY